MDGYIHRSRHSMASYIKASGPKFKGQFLQCQEVPDHIQIIYNMSRDHCPIFLPLIMENNASCLNYISEASHGSSSYFLLLQVHKIF
jgi:hypothetical protein